METDAIIMKNVVKEFKVLNRHEGLKGSFKDLFSRDYKKIKAVDNISINIIKTCTTGVFGVLYEITDEFKYFFVPSTTNDSSLNPDEELTIMF